MPKLDATLENMLALWRARVAEGDASQADVVTVGVAYRGDPAALRRVGLELGYDDGRIVSGRIRLADVERLVALPEVLGVTVEPKVRIHDGSVPELRVPWKVPPATPWPGRGAGVIVAVIDTGIDIFHDSFRKNDGTTRILELWDQEMTAVGGANPPAGFIQSGKVYDLPTINTALTAGPPFHSIDTNGHGTHVAGIAAGNGRQDDRCSFPGHYVGVAPEADLVVVRAIALPNGQSGSVRDALIWCAQAGSRHPDPDHPGPRPVVINCSFGNDIGSHDGTGFFETAIDERLRPPGQPVPSGLAIVCSAGNDGEGKIHENGIIAAHGSQSVDFTIPNPSYDDDDLDIWYSGFAALDVTLTAPPNPAVPGPNTIGPISPGMAGSPFALGKMQIAVSSTTGASTLNNKRNIRITFSATAASAAEKKKLALRPGRWTLTLTETAGTAAIWDAWFQTSHTDGFPVFEPSEDVPDRRRSNTITDMGMARNAISVANYQDSDGLLAATSSRGADVVPPGTPAGEVKPTIAAPGSSVAAPRSRDDPDSNSSCCDQKVIDKSGTSMASPHVAGLVALMFQKNRTLTFEDVRRILQRTARIDGIPFAEVPQPWVPPDIRVNSIWGSGKADAAAALTAAQVPGGGGGGGGGGIPAPAIVVDDGGWGYTPPTIFSRLGDWQARHGRRPGLLLVASLVSEHVDEVLRLINGNRRVAAVWRRGGGPDLVRHLLHGPSARPALMPATVGSHAIAPLMEHFLPVLARFGSARLRGDITRFGDFAKAWPGADLDRLDAAALAFAARP